MTAKQLAAVDDEKRRRKVFRALVGLQDLGKGVVESRARIVREFATNIRELRRIEEEGIECGWPPL